MRAADHLPEGVHVEKLVKHADDRGSLIEIFREQWEPPVRLIQWNAVESRLGVLRGVHVHPRHDDYLVLLHGRMLLGLHDMRPDSPTAGCGVIVELKPAAAQCALIPHGVAHGFYFPEPACHLYGVTQYWNPADELGCRWDDRQLAIPWPRIAPALSPRDAGLPPFAALREQLGAVGAEV